MGLGRGLFNNYGPIYLQEQMDASSAMIGKNILIERNKGDFSKGGAAEIYLVV